MPDNQNKTTNQNEFEINTPQKKNDDIKTTERKLDKEERKERKDPNHPTYQDTADQDKEWPQEKLNEANNEKHDSVREGISVTKEKVGADDNSDSQNVVEKGNDSQKDSRERQRKDEEQRKRKESAA